ncbi:hypothetical protein ALC57_06671 [Trachymyrmex cornetzi]|uniref:Uncharacterized protein n=1 Tax=Trachymyrmex cornetzi TaxID=471704 RepID=A0A195E6D6_9HYME|nr:hypothetical protein ALC57_06671 [Trachymyrmex cornetzi]
METVRLFTSAIVPRDGASQYFAPLRRDAEKGAPDQHPHATCCNPRTYDCVVGKIFASYTFESRAASLLKNYEAPCARDSRETRPTHFDRSSAEGSTTDVQSEQHREKELTATTPCNVTNNQSTRAIIGANIYPTDKEQIDIREPGLLYSQSSVDVQYTTPVRVG